VTFPELVFFEEADGFFFAPLGFPVAKELRLSPDLPRLPPIALGVSSGIVCKSGSSTVMMPGSGLRTAPRRPPSCPPPTSFSIRFSVTSWPRRLGEEDLSEAVEEVVGRGTVTGGVLLSPIVVCCVGGVRITWPKSTANWRHQTDSHWTVSEGTPGGRVSTTRLAFGWARRTGTRGSR